MGEGVRSLPFRDTKRRCLSCILKTMRSHLKFLSIQVSSWVCILGNPPCQQWRRRIGNVDWYPENHQGGSSCNRLLYLSPFPLSRFLKSRLLFYLQVLNLVSASASFPKWPSPKSPMTFIGGVCHCLIWPLGSVNTIDISHLPATYFLCFFFHSE